MPPFFTCGECGGEIGRWPMRNLLKQDILDWRHRTVPDAWQDTPHRAVLGTPVRGLRLHVQEEKLSARREAPPLPVVPARPAMHGELPTSAERLDRAAAAAGWLVEAWYMRGTRMDAYWRPGRVMESVVLRLVRDGHGLVAYWATDGHDEWAFDEAWSLTHHVVRPIGSDELKKIVKEPRMLCDTCGEPPALHVSTPGGLVCYCEFHSADGTSDELPQGGTP